MNVKGEIFKKRSYENTEDRSVNCLLFINVCEGVMIDGNRVNTLPMLVSDEGMDYKIGDTIEVKGTIEFRRLITSSGKLSFYPLPVIIPETLYQLNLE